MGKRNRNGTRQFHVREGASREEMGWGSSGTDVEMLGRGCIEVGGGGMLGGEMGRSGL